jgi:hypothetical protein
VLPADHSWCKPLPRSQQQRRRSQLKRLRYYLAPRQTLEQWKADLKRQLLDGRDPDKVSPLAIGRVLVDWTLAKRLYIERMANVFGHRKGWKDFKATTIAPIDATPAEVSRHQ